MSKNLYKNISTDLLPDKELIRRVKEKGDSESYLVLNKKYSNVFYKICHKFAPVLISAGIDSKDIFEEKDITLLNCIHSYKWNKKTKFSTFLGNYARFLCLNSLHARKRQLPMATDELFEFIENSQANEECTNNPNCDKKELLSTALDCLKKNEDVRLYEVFVHRVMYTDKKPTWKIIAKRMNISSQTAINIYRRAIDILRSELLPGESVPSN